MNVLGVSYPILDDWVLNKKHNTIVGYIYNDTAGRWSDGTLIETSRLRPMAQQISSPRENGTIETLNTTYYLGTRKSYERN